MIKSLVLFTFLERGSAGIIPNDNETQSPRGDEVIIGDMILTQEQYELMYGEGTRSGVPETSIFRRWPNKKLPCEIDSSVLPSDRVIVENTIHRFNDQMNGCFQIV